jgi:hypothetical protein
VKSAFAEDGVVVQIVGRHDWALRHALSGAFIYSSTLA